MKNTLRLNHCMMYVSDLDRSIRFYREALGFEVVDRHRYVGHDLAYLQSPTSPMEIELIKPDAGPPVVRGGEPVWHFGFAVEDLDDEFRRLGAIGVQLDPIENYIANGSLQTRYFYFYDPDGHQIEILEARGRYARPIPFK